jgi:protein TonB
MRSSDFILPFLISATIHVGVLSSDILHHNAEVFFEKGASAVTLNIVPSLASKVSSVIPAVADPAAKQSVSAQPSPGEVIISKKASLIQDVPLHPKEKLVVEQHTRIIHESEVRKDRAKREAAPEYIFPQPHIEESETEPLLSAEFSLQDKKEQVQHTYNRIGVAAVNSKNNNGDRNEKGVTSPVVVTGLSKPKYPRYSRINGEEGTVVFIVEVSANGRPGKIEVETSSGYQRLDYAAVKALEKASFTPARLGGKAVASIKRIAFRFDLEEYGN